LRSRQRRRSSFAVVVVAAAATLMAALGTPASAAPAAPAEPPPGPAEPAAPGPTVDNAQRGALLQRDWRTSPDIAWTTSGDASGFHVLTATARSGYTWQTAASLSEPGFEADAWIGNACLTGSGDRLVVVYGPRTFTNKADLFDRGGFTAVVDLRNGAVTKVPVQSSLAYFNPGCGAGETAVVSQFGGERVNDPASKRLQSRLHTIDAATGRLSEPILLDTEVSSAVPVGDGIVAAGAGALVRVGRDGRLKRLAQTDGVPFRLVPDPSGGVVFVDRDRDRLHVKRAVPGAKTVISELAEGALTEVGVTRAAGGRAFLTGSPSRVRALPKTVRRVAVPAGSELSSTGALALTRVGPADVADPRVDVDRGVDLRPVAIDAKVTATGKTLTFRVAPKASGPNAATGAATHPTLGRQAGTRAPGAAAGPSASAAGSPTDPVDAERYCSVPRNDPRNQAMQPKPRQVEWAVDQAITNSLHLTREANWKNLGMPAYSPQGLFPSINLINGGRVPAQIMLGIAAQESNMWQAARFALPGVTANPLIGNFYGRDIYNDTSADDWTINWAKADCGYGVLQVTDHMRLAGHEKDANDTAWPLQTQRAVALDFATNIAAGLRILQDKWNQTTANGLIVHDGDPTAMENWFFAVWAYNSGYHPNHGDGTPWGVGWGNNPINPRFDPQRKPFLETSYDDARTPQKWPYPEKIMGWAGHPIDLYESPDTLVSGYRAAWWAGGPTEGPKNRAKAKPPLDTFCNATNDCTPGAKIKPNDPDVANEPAGPCGHIDDAGYYDLRCWYHEPVSWQPTINGACNACGVEVLRFDPGYAYQEDGTSYPPLCTLDGLPAGARVIDNLPDGTPSVRPGCGRPWTNAGTFALSFLADQSGSYPGKVDLHQIGAGFGGHMWRAHTRTAAAEGGKLKVTGTWTSSTSMIGWTRILVSVPDHGAWTRQAKYTIDLGNGQTRYRIVNQAWRAHRWIDLGVFPTGGRPSVTLTNVTSDGTGDDSVIFDAVAFVPTAKPSAVYVAMGDSFATGEGNAPYDRNSDFRHAVTGGEDKNACHRSEANAYPRQVRSPGHTSTIAQEAAAGTASFAFVACSGAGTTAVSTDAVNATPTADDRDGHTDWGTADQRWGEVAQVDQGYLDQDTTLVSINIGGNDARFIDVLHGCVLAIGDCSDADYRLTRRNGKVDPAPLRTYESTLIREWLPGHLKAVYWAIHAKAPNAKILVVGYPQLFPETPLEGCYRLTPDIQRFLNNLASLLTLTIARAVDDVRVEGPDIQFVDPTPSYRLGLGSNQHWACPQMSDPWLNDVTLPSESNSGRDTPGVGTFHPNAAGQRQYANLVNSALQGYSSGTRVQNRIKTYLASRSLSITDPQAAEAADRCLYLARKGGLVGDPCMTMPIIFPTANDARGAAQNDDEALKAHPEWVGLNYVSSTNEKPKVLPRNWMNQPTRVTQTTCPTPRPTNMQCDEFPFYSSEAGGAWDPYLGETSPASTRLRLIPDTENRREGVMLNGMYSACRMQSGTYDATYKVLLTSGTPYLTVPLLNPATTRETFYVC
jgi:hypothetical protein